MARKAPTIQKTREKRKERKELFLAFTYELQLRGLNVDAHFWQKGPIAEKAQQYERNGEKKY